MGEQGVYNAYLARLTVWEGAGNEPLTKFLISYSYAGPSQEK